jgi:hypothetical protein
VRPPLGDAPAVEHQHLVERVEPDRGMGDQQDRGVAAGLQQVVDEGARGERVELRGGLVEADMAVPIATTRSSPGGRGPAGGRARRSRAR